MPASDLARIAGRLPLLASPALVKAALKRLRTPLAQAVRAAVDRRFTRRTGLLRRSISTITTRRGIAARVSGRAWYAQIHEGGPRPFVRPVVQSFADPAAVEIAREIEAVKL